MTHQNIKYHCHTATTHAWDAMLESCKKAKHSILLEEYIYDPDVIGTSFTETLLEKAKEGVDIKLLLDWWGCRKIRYSPHYKQLKEAGVEMRFFRPPSWEWLYSSPKLFPRDHRKILIVDNDTTFTGGVCIYDNVAHWRDTMVEISGDVTKQFVYTFDKVWHKCTGNSELINAHPPHGETEEFTVYANAPDSHEHQFTNMLIKRITNARHSVKLTTPYFTPTSLLMPVLEDALRRGVKLEIILSNYSKVAPYVVGKTLIGLLIKQGAMIYYYQPKMLHLKMMIVDENWAAIGSCNLDGLSIHHNQEAMLLATNQPFVAELNQHFENDKADSVRFSYEDWQARPMFQKLAGWVLMPFRYYL